MYIMEKIVFAVLAFLITILFLISGVQHLFNLKNSTLYLQSHFPFSHFPFWFNFIVEITATFIEILAPVFIILGIFLNKFKEFAKISTFFLAFFLICNIIFIHNPFYEGEFQNFLKHLSFLGGVLLIGENLVIN